MISRASTRHAQPANVRYVGVVSSWRPQGDYGWILPALSSHYVFVHVADTPDRLPLAPGTRVTFRIAQSALGRTKATDVRLEETTRG